MTTTHIAPTENDVAAAQLLERINGLLGIETPAVVQSLASMEPAQEVAEIEVTELAEPERERVPDVRPYMFIPADVHGADPWLADFARSERQRATYPWRRSILEEQLPKGPIIYVVGPGEALSQLAHRFESEEAQGSESSSERGTVG